MTRTIGRRGFALGALGVAAGALALSGCAGEQDAEPVAETDEAQPAAMPTVYFTRDISPRGFSPSGTRSA